jgi:hypothetical protein
VSQLSDWQRQYKAFSDEQIGFVQNAKAEAKI